MARLRLEMEGATEMVKGQTLTGLECHTKSAAGAQTDCGCISLYWRVLNPGLGL